MIVNFRIDDRLVHGQVALAWSKALGTQGIVVANDGAATNEIQKMSLKMAAPTGQKLIIQTVNDAITLLKNPKANNMKLFVIVSRVIDALVICRACPEIKEVNCAGVGRLDLVDKSLKKEVIKSAVYLVDDEVSALKQLIELGVYVYSQQLPELPKLNIADSIKSL